MQKNLYFLTIHNDHLYRDVDLTSDTVIDAQFKRHNSLQGSSEPVLYIESRQNDSLWTNLSVEMYFNFKKGKI